MPCKHESLIYAKSGRLNDNMFSSSHEIAKTWKRQSELLNNHRNQNMNCILISLANDVKHETLLHMWGTCFHIYKFPRVDVCDKNVTFTSLLMSPSPHFKRQELVGAGMSNLRCIMNERTISYDAFPSEGEIFLKYILCQKLPLDARHKGTHKTAHAVAIPRLVKELGVIFGSYLSIKTRRLNLLALALC